MEVKPKIGFDNIKFGMLKDEIIAILGEPNQMLVDQYDEGEYRLEWNELKLRLSFQRDHRFTYYSSKNQKLNYKGHSVIDKDIEEIKSLFFNEFINDSNDWEIVDYQTFRTHFIENIFLTLHSEYKKVNEFELGVPFKNETEFDFPN